MTTTYAPACSDRAAALAPWVVARKVDTLTDRQCPTAADCLLAKLGPWQPKFQNARRFPVAIFLRLAFVRRCRSTPRKLACRDDAALRRQEPRPQRRQRSTLARSLG